MEDNPYEGKTLYSEEEILRVLGGLTNVYWSKNWLIRIFYRPWFDALQTAGMILCSNVLTEGREALDLFGDIDAFLEDADDNSRRS